MVVGRLDEITDRVIRRGVFVVDQQRGEFRVLNYFNETPVLTDIPNHEWATTLCNALNDGADRSNLPIIQQLVNRYHSLKRDQQVFQRISERVKDVIKRDVAQIRFHEANWQCQEIGGMIQLYASQCNRAYARR